MKTSIAITILAQNKVEVKKCVLCGVQPILYTIWSSDMRDSSGACYNILAQHHLLHGTKSTLASSHKQNRGYAEPILSLRKRS